MCALRLNFLFWAGCIRALQLRREDQRPMSCLRRHATPPQRRLRRDHGQVHQVQRRLKAEDGQVRGS